MTMGLYIAVHAAALLDVLAVLCLGTVHSCVSFMGVPGTDRQLLRLKLAVL